MEQSEQSLAQVQGHAQLDEAAVESPIENPEEGEQEELGPEDIFMIERVVPAFFEVTRAMIEQRPDAEVMAEELIGSLWESAREAGESGEGLWTSAAKVFRAILTDRKAAMELVEDTKALDEHPGYAWKVLCTLCYLGGSMDPNVLPALAINLHLGVVEFVCRGTMHMSDVYEKVVAEWFAVYWKHTFENARFRFYAPRLVELDFRVAKASDPSVRVQRILCAMADGLGMSLPERGREWFEGRA